MKKIIVFCVAWVGLFGALMAQDKKIDEQQIRDTILQDVRKQGIDQSAEVQAAVRAAQEGVLIRAWEQKVVASHPVGQALKDAVYKDLGQLLGDQEFKLFHVFVNDEKAAKTLITKMKETRDWTQLEPKTLWGNEVKFSLSRTDWINLSAVLAEFRQTVRAMKKGDITAEPIKAKDGWHVVGLVDARAFKLPPPERIEKEILRLAERKIIEQQLQTLLQAKTKQ